MSGHEILIAVMAGFAVLGAIDRVLGNRFGLGEKFEEGILAMGPLGVAMLGVISLAPVLAAVLRPVIAPVFGALGADPAMFAGSLLACDMGGGVLARELTADTDAAALGGIITGSMLGATLVFTIPVAMGILAEEIDTLYPGEKHYAVMDGKEHALVDYCETVHLRGARALAEYTDSY